MTIKTPPLIFISDYIIHSFNNSPLQHKIIKNNKNEGGIYLNECYPFENQPLPYALDSLEPYIDAKTLQIHHDRLLGTYIDKLNLLLSDKPYLQCMNLEELICISCRLPRDTGIPLSRYAGGVYNHLLYFNCMTPVQKNHTETKTYSALGNKYGNYDEFRKQFTEAANSVFGSGYAWLVLGRRGLSITTLPNQENPLVAGTYPLFCLDVWEHAYFLMYYNKRVEYIGDFWNLINWEYIDARYNSCMLSCKK